MAIKKTKPLLKRARVAAAAPQMLSALKYAIAQADANLPNFGGERSADCWKSYNRCVRAIAKAEGR